MRVGSFASLAFAKTLAACVLAASALMACGGSAVETGANGTQQGSQPINVANPSGNCVAPDSGARPGYHAPAESVWLPDCQCPLAREYWRVFAFSAESAYLIPRPDGAPELRHICESPTDPLRPVVDAHALCRSASSTADVDKVNSIPPADALAVAREMHRALRFIADEHGITPFPIPSDILDACALHESENDADFAAICTRERERMQSGSGIGFSYTGPGAAKLALRLNELYAIPLD